MKNKTLAILAITLSLALAAKAQVAQGGTYKLDQAVVAGGGAQNLTGGTLSLDGTDGQSIAGTNSSNSPFALQSGFWTAAPIAPTAAAVIIAGKISTPEGRGLRNALVILTDMQGNRKTVTSSAFGYFRFAEVEAGQTYILTVVSKRYQFSPQILTALDNIDNLSFIAQP